MAKKVKCIFCKKKFNRSAFSTWPYCSMRCVDDFIYDSIKRRKAYTGTQ